MGFHRRHLTEDFIISAYENYGIEGVVNLVTKPDAILFDSNCKICAGVVKAISQNDLQTVKSILDDTIKKYDRKLNT